MSDPHPPPPSPSSSSSAIHSVSQAVVDVPNVTGQAAVVPIAPEENRNQFLLQWQNLMMTFCFTSALEIAILFAQSNESQFPASFHLLSFAILLIFLSLFVANFIGDDFATITQALEIIAVMLVVTAFVFTIAIPFPLSLKCTSWTMYAVCLLAILICRYRF